MEKLQHKIVSLYNEYMEFQKLLQDKNKEFLAKKEDMPNLLKEGLNENLESMLIHIYSDMVLYNQDLQFLFMILMTNIITYVELSKDPLSEEIKQFYDSHKQWYPKRAFAIEKEQLVEAEKGSLEVKRKEFLESDYYKSILKQGNLLSDKE